MEFRKKSIIVRSLFFTFIELLIVISIISLIGGVVAINMQKSYQEQLELNDMSAVVHLFNKSIDLMMLVNMDCEIKFFYENEKLHVQFEPKSSLSPLIKKLIAKKPILLENIHSVSFKDGFQDTILTPPFSILMLSKGYIMNRGVLIMQGNQTVGSLVLPGYPTSFSLIKGISNFTIESQSDEMIEAITNQTRQETGSEFK